MLNWLYGMFVLPESLKPENRREFSLSKSNPFAALMDLRRYPLVSGLATAYFLLSLGHQVFPSIWALYTEEKFGWQPREIGYSLGLVGIMAVIVQGGLVRWIVPKIRERKAAVLGTCISICSLLGYGFVNSAELVYVIIVFGALAGIANPAIQGIISRTVRTTNRAKCRVR